MIEHRRAQLMHPGKRQLHLRLDTGDARHHALRRVIDQVVQQRRLAHTRLATHHKCLALTRAHSVDQPVEQPALAVPTPELRDASRGEKFGHLTSTDETPPTDRARR